MMMTIGTTLVRRTTAGSRALSALLLGSTRPLTRTLVGGALAAATKPKRVLRAEHALLRQQLLIVRRPGKRPRLTPGARARLVLLARLTQTWPSALLLVPPQTLLRWPRPG